MTEIMDLTLSSLLLVWSGVIVAARGDPSGDDQPLKVSYGQWGANCDPVDSCRKEAELPFNKGSDRNCACDENYILWNNCCFDAEFNSTASLPKLREKYISVET
ncbi:hypothetical protein CDAR_479431 [Caerostris darwini]|uniref:Uncharacterized protein n=1 Tax=Caerostris darwini TaxID=1538125 RepID=A0AAV4MRV8_9ARAC|nr:hypothetical protein CDAR_479431 [Caerostris darwini]